MKCIPERFFKQITIDIRLFDSSKFHIMKDFESRELLQGSSTGVVVKIKSTIKFHFYMFVRKL